MRIIAGDFRSRRIQALRGLDVRPTPDRLREALFNVLASRIAGASFIDAYAGCGSVGIEATSRGAAEVTFIERKHAAVEMIRRNLRSLGLTGGFQIRNGKAAPLLATLTADIVFLDPPYELDREYQAALDALAGNPPPLAIVQHASRDTLADDYGPLHRTRILRHGDNSLSFYEATD